MEIEMTEQDKDRNQQTMFLKYIVGGIVIFTTVVCGTCGYQSMHSDNSKASKCLDIEDSTKK